MNAALSSNTAKSAATPQTENIQTVQARTGRPRIPINELHTTNATLCERVTISRGEDDTLNADTINQSLRSATSRYYPNTTNIQQFFGYQPIDGSICWECMDAGTEWLIFYRLIGDVHSRNTYLLQLIGSRQKLGIQPDKLCEMATDIQQNNAHEESPPSVAYAAYCSMQVLYNALQSNKITDINSAEVTRMLVVTPEKIAEHKYILRDEFVRKVENKFGRVHEWNIEEPFVICSSLSSGLGNPRKIIDASITHFAQGHAFSNIQRPPNKAFNYRTADDENGNNHVFVFAIKNDHKVGSFDIVMLKSTPIDVAELSTMCRSIMLLHADEEELEDNEFEYKLTRMIDRAHDTGRPKIKVQAITYNGRSFSTATEMNIVKDNFIQLIIDGNGCLCMYPQSPNSLPPIGIERPLCIGVDNTTETQDLMEAACDHYFKAITVSYTEAGTDAARRYGANHFKVGEEGNKIRFLNFGVQMMTGDKYNLYIDSMRTDTIEPPGGPGRQ